MSKSTAKNHTQAIWRMRLCSALRAALACAIVGITTLHGPKPLVAYLKFPAFSYVIVIIILSNATTLGHALSGCWHAFYATVQVVPLAMLGRWLVSPSERVELPLGLAALVAAVASFLVTLPESTHLTAKRIALGQIALICTEIVVISNKTSHGFMNPLHIGASAILGSVACLLASLLPFPGLAHNEVKKLCQLYAENASERMDIYLKAFNAKDHKIKTELVLQAKPTAEIGTKLLQNIKTLQEGIPWERPWSLYSENNNSINFENRLQSLEATIRAIEYSLTKIPSSPSQIFDQEKLELLSVFVSTQLHNRIQKIEQFSPSNPPLESNLPTQQQKYESSCFVSSCIDMLLNGKDEKNERQKFKFQIPKLDLLSALKCSFALGLAVLLGVTLERDNARWAGLTVAISFAMGPRPIFTTANARAQGTALGSVYALIFCFLFRQPDLRLLALIPWIAFSTFLKHSKMYGQTGGISAAIGASVILGRKNFGPPNEFAIGRLTAVFVGLFCLVIVEIVFQQATSAKLAKSQLRETLVSLGELIKETRVYRKNEFLSKISLLGERLKTLNSIVDDVESEPGFWYMPFQGGCYKRVVGCLYNVVCVLYVVRYNLENGIEVRKEFEERLGWELEELEGIVNLSLEKVCLIGSSKTADCGGGDGGGGGDVEAGKLEKTSSLISEDEKEIRVIRFCIGSLRKEIEEIEVCIKEIVRWDNHSSC